jgi:hypothetical protein
MGASLFKIQQIQGAKRAKWLTASASSDLTAFGSALTIEI